MEKISSKYINTELCTECGGRCCKQCGGIFAPEQFEDLSVEGLVKTIIENNYSIDWWEGSPVPDEERMRTIYIRTRNVDQPIIDPSWAGTACTLFIPGKGCRLSFEKRPLECQCVVPDWDKDTGEYTCIISTEDRADKKQLSIRWLPHQDVLEEVADKLWEYEE